MLINEDGRRTPKKKNKRMKIDASSLKKKPNDSGEI
jgi:hypothetical protein